MRSLAADCLQGERRRTVDRSGRGERRGAAVCRLELSVRGDPGFPARRRRRRDQSRGQHDLGARERAAGDECRNRPRRRPGRDARDALASPVRPRSFREQCARSTASKGLRSAAAGAPGESRTATALTLGSGSLRPRRLGRKEAFAMLTRDEDVLTAAESWREAGRDVAIATVVETWGSAPRPVGSHLVIDGEGNFLGSVSGGCVEGEVVTEALDVIADGAPKMLEFGVADETAWRVGLSCGGRIRVYVEKLA